MIETETITQKIVPIKRWRNAIRMKIPYWCGTTLEVQTKMFDFGNELGLACAMKIVTENVGQFQWPEDWWQAFKERWLPSIHRWWPVKYKKLDVEALYVNMPIPKSDRMNLVFKGSLSNEDKPCF